MKTVITRALQGFAYGTAISYLIAVIISLSVHDGRFYICTPLLAEMTGSEMAAGAVQFILSGILGAVCGGASVLWETEKLSLMARSAAYFALLAAAMFPIAYVCGWMEHSIVGFLSYFAMFVSTYAAYWIAGYFHMKKKITEINKKIAE